MFPHCKKTYLHRQKNIKVPVNSVISGCDYIISASDYIITTTDFIITDADYKINRHFRKNY